MIITAIDDEKRATQSEEKGTAVNLKREDWGSQNSSRDQMGKGSPYCLLVRLAMGDTLASAIL
jgi:hypothetical protein